MAHVEHPWMGPKTSIICMQSLSQISRESDDFGFVFTLPTDSQPARPGPWQKPERMISLVKCWMSQAGLCSKIAQDEIFFSSGFEMCATPFGVAYVKPLPLKGIKPNDDAWQPRPLIRARRLMLKKHRTILDHLPEFLIQLLLTKFGWASSCTFQGPDSLNIWLSGFKRLQETFSLDVLA